MQLVQYIFNMKRMVGPRLHNTGRLHPERMSASNNVSSSFLGCVTSPLSSKTNSWSNLVQLENNRSDLAYTLDEESMELGAITKDPQARLLSIV
jgi:hypothetical protein